MGLNRIDPRHGVANLAYWLGSEHEGRGLITAACRALLQHAFDTVGLHRVHIHAATDNLRSQAVARRLGFRHEGTLREAELVRGQRLDLEVFSLLRHEWPA